MKKVLINRCFDCPYCKTFGSVGEEGFFCVYYYNDTKNKADRPHLMNDIFNEINDSCPLEEVKE
jgi:hypothetical protein